jgi:hypothetical protein
MVGGRTAVLVSLPKVYIIPLPVLQIAHNYYSPPLERAVYVALPYAR